VLARRATKNELDKAGRWLYGIKSLPPGKVLAARCKGSEGAEFESYHARSCTDGVYSRYVSGGLAPVWSARDPCFDIFS